jgi:tetratricopeptide (TPR) repeat protein
MNRGRSHHLANLVGVVSLFVACHVSNLTFAQTTRLIALSLREAERSVKASQKLLAPEVGQFGGMTEIIGFIIDNQSADIIIVGRDTRKSPPFTFDDFVYILRCGREGGFSGPGVTLEPKGGDISSDKLEVQFFGGIENSSPGRVVFDADYMMKKIALDKLASGVEEILSYAKLTERRFMSGGVETWKLLSRFWFAPTYTPVDENETGDLCLLKEVVIGVLVQNLSAELNGRQQAHGYKDEAAETYASLFTRHYEKVAYKHVEFDNLSRFTGAVKVASLLLNRVEPARLRYWLDVYQPSRVSIPDEVPLLKKSVTDSKRELIISGGVKMASLTLRLRGGEINAVRDALLLARPSQRTVSWSVTLTKDWRLILPSASPEDQTMGNLFVDGMMLREEGEYTQAVDVFNRILKAHPEAVEAAFAKGLALRDLGVKFGMDEKVKESLECLEQVKRSHPNSAEASYEHAATLRIIRRTDDAITEFRVAIRRDSSYSLLYHGLGLALKDKGRIDEAIESFEKFLALDPRNRLVAKTQQIIEGLREETGLRSAAPDTSLKEYVNEQYGLTCEYPSAWWVLSPAEFDARVGKSNVTSQAIVIFFVNPKDYDQNTNIQVITTDEESLSDADVEQLEHDLDAAYSQNFTGYKKISSRKVSINGMIGIDYVFSSTKLGLTLQQRTVTVVKRRLACLITSTAPQDVFENVNRRSFQRIVESLRIR